MILIVCFHNRYIVAEEMTEKEKELFEAKGDWECKNCQEENYKTDMRCDECYADRRYSAKDLGMPAFNWKELRELYKECIIKDVPEEIPEFAAKHLRTDMERYMYKRTRWMVKQCIDHEAWNRKYIKPSDLQIKLQNLDMGEISESIRKMRIIDYLEEIYWTASMHLCDILEGEPELFGYMGLLLHSRSRPGFKQVMEERFEKLKDHPNTIIIKSMTDKKKKYYLNVELQMCTCPSYDRQGGPCKHLLAHKK